MYERAREIGNLAAHEQRLTFFESQSEIDELAILYQTQNCSLAYLTYCTLRQFLPPSIKLAILYSRPAPRLLSSEFKNKIKLAWVVGADTRA